MYGIRTRWILFLLCVTSIVCVKQDIVFLLDTSSGYGDGELNTAIDFIYNVSSYLTISTNDTLVSVVSFAVTATEQFDFDDNQSQETLLNSTSSLKSLTSTGNAQTYDALLLAANIFTSDKGARDDARNIVVVVTNSLSTSKTQTSFNSMILKTKVESVYVVGINSTELTIDSTELDSIASDPDDQFRFLVDSSSLCQLLSTIVPELSDNSVTVSSDICYGPDSAAGTNESTNDDEAAIIAGVISAVVGLIIAVVLVCVCIKKSKKKRINSELIEITSEHGNSETMQPLSETATTSNGVSGMSSRSSTRFTLATLKSYIKENTADISVVDITNDPRGDDTLPQTNSQEQTTSNGQLETLVESDKDGNVSPSEKIDRDMSPTETQHTSGYVTPSTDADVSSNGTHGNFSPIGSQEIERNVPPSATQESRKSVFDKFPTNLKKRGSKQQINVLPLQIEEIS